MKTKEIKRMISNAKTSNNIMTKIKGHYDKSKSGDVDHYLRKSNSLKSKNNDDSLEIISELTSLNFLMKRITSLENWKMQNIFILQYLMKSD